MIVELLPSLAVSLSMHLINLLERDDTLAAVFDLRDLTVEDLTSLLSQTLGASNMENQSWNALRRMAAQGYSDGIICLATIEIVERSNRSSIIGPLNDNHAGQATRMLIDGAMYRLHMLLTRAFAPVRHKDDWHLRSAIEFLQQPGRIDEERWDESRRDLEKAVELFVAADADPRIKSLRHMRDKELAHLGKFDEGIQRPRYNDLFYCARSAAAIWERLSYGAGTVMIPIDNQIDVYREEAENFWSKWERD